MVTAQDNHADSPRKRPQAPARSCRKAPGQARDRASITSRQVSGFWFFRESLMHRFEIGPDLATGNPDIDDHLQTLFNLANEILFLPAPERDSPGFRRAATFLFSYLEYHFASEELAMLEQGYPSRRFHAAFHDHVRREAAKIRAGLSRKLPIEETRSAIFFLLEDWAVYHVAIADRQLADHLREHSPAGVAPRLPGILPLKASGTIAADFDERILAAVAGQN
jgi:hemerythrin-like metal-binding protein